jgi:hypothetical protein
MPLQVRFSQETLYKLLDDNVSASLKVNAISFEPVLDPESKRIVNIKAIAAHHNRINNKLHKKCVGSSPKVFKLKWGLSTDNSCAGTLGESNIISKSTENYNEIDMLANNIKNGKIPQNEAEPIIVYDLVLFTKEQIVQIFKGKDLKITANSSKFKMTLVHTLTDFGMTFGKGEKKARKCISLLASGYTKKLVGGLEVDVVAADNPFGSNATAFQIGQPCPPDWWFSEEPLIAGP